MVHELRNLSSIKSQKNVKKLVFGNWEGKTKNLRINLPRIRPKYQLMSFQLDYFPRIILAIRKIWFLVWNEDEMPILNGSFILYNCTCHDHFSEEFFCGVKNIHANWKPFTYKFEEILHFDHDLKIHFTVKTAKIAKTKPTFAFLFETIELTTPTTTTTLPITALMFGQPNIFHISFFLFSSNCRWKRFSIFF